MVPCRDKDNYHQLKETTTDYHDLVNKLEAIVVEKVPNTEQKVGLNAVDEGDNEPCVGDEFEVVNPETGDIEISKFSVSGRWTMTGVKARKPGKGGGNGDK